MDSVIKNQNLKNFLQIYNRQKTCVDFKMQNEIKQQQDNQIFTIKTKKSHIDFVFNEHVLDCYFIMQWKNQFGSMCFEGDFSKKTYLQILMYIFEIIENNKLY